MTWKAFVAFNVHFQLNPGFDEEWVRNGEEVVQALLTAAVQLLVRL